MLKRTVSNDFIKFDFLNGFQSAANGLSGTIVNITKPLNDVPGSNATDAFMDAASGIGHRVVHGHGLENLPVIYNKFGLEGVGDYMTHGLRDFMSPHGMPIPYANQIGDFLGFRTMQKVDWLSVNVGNVVAGGASWAHTIHNSKNLILAVSTGYLPVSLVVGIAVGSTVKIGFSILNPNPISLASGVADLGLLTYALHPAFIYGKAYFVKGKVGAYAVFKTVSTGAVAGSASAAMFGGAIMVWKKIKSKGKIFDKEALKRLHKYAFAGACGGACGAATGMMYPEPVTVASVTIGGYIAGEAVFEKVFQGTPDQSPSEGDSGFSWWLEGMTEA